MKYLIMSFILSLIFTPLAIKLGIVDIPNYRKIHDKPIAKAGGLGIFIPVIIMMCLCFTEKKATKMSLGILLVIVFFLIVGVIDDKIELKAKTKLSFQCITAIISIYLGIVFKLTSIDIVNYIITFSWIVCIINAVNLIDGLDGLAAGVGAISTIQFMIIALVVKDDYLIFFCLILTGSLMGFLKFNFRPAKIFMGDTGSLPLGYALAVLGILCSNKLGGFQGMMFSTIVLFIPIFDTILTMYRRYIKGVGIFCADRSHFYNLLMDLKGIEHKNVVILLYFINLHFGVMAIIYSVSNIYFRIIEFVLIIIISIYLIVKLEFVKVDAQASVPKGDFIRVIE